MKHSPDGKLMLSSSWDGGLAIWDAHTSIPISKSTVCNQGVLSAVFSPGSDKILGCDASGVIKVWMIHDVIDD